MPLFCRPKKYSIRWMYFGFPNISRTLHWPPEKWKTLCSWHTLSLFRTSLNCMIESSTIRTLNTEHWTRSAENTILFKWLHCYNIIFLGNLNFDIVECPCPLHLSTIPSMMSTSWMMMLAENYLEFWWIETLYQQIITHFRFLFNRFGRWLHLLNVFFKLSKSISLSEYMFSFR